MIALLTVKTASQSVLAIGRSPRWFGFSSRPSQLFLFPLVAIYL